MLDAVRNVITQNLLFHAPQRRAHGGDLRDDIDAVSILRDHARKAAYLTFDPIEPLEARLLDIITHERYIPLPGKRFKWIIRPCPETLIIVTLWLILIGMHIACRRKAIRWSIRSAG